MNNLYNKIYEAVDTGIQKALIITDNQIDDVSVKYYPKEKTTEFKPYEYRFVDLGLSVKWAEYNLGSFPGNNPNDWCGNYYAWGETEVNDDYSWETYKHCNGSQKSLIKYNTDSYYGIVDNKKFLNTSDDVAAQILGKQYRMPVKEDFDELLNNTTNEWVKNYKNIHGLNGMLLISKINSNTLFFPAVGYFYDSILDDTGSTGSVWSASLYSDLPNCAWNLNFDSGDIYMDYGNRYLGFSVRAVQDSPLK